METDYEALSKYIEEKSGITLTAEDQKQIALAFSKKHLRKRQYLLQEGDVCKKMAFITKGAGRIFSVSDKGHEHIIRFAVENWWLGDFESFNYGSPSRYNIEMLEDSDLLIISKENLQPLTDNVQAFDLMIKEIDKKGAVASQTRIHSSISLNAEERYEDFVKAYPMLANRFPQNMIASYLGISPETLSRIRKNMLRN